ncbi:NnrU family protein [Aliiruegeria lutimaris]|nr:NnrU family protein [Aliiruegeria lutimaris]
MIDLAGWEEFVCALLFFLLSHAIPVRPPVKAAIVARTSTRAFTLGYSALSLGALGWLIGATGRAPGVLLWDRLPWQTYVPLVGMALACAIAALAIARPNPLSFGGAQNARFDPQAPGIVGWFRHPLLVALLIWSLGHIPPNGELAPVLLFALFAGFSVLGMRIIDRRMQRQLGPVEWQRLATTRRALRVTPGGVKRLLWGALAYLALVYAHESVIGVTPLP